MSDDAGRITADQAVESSAAAEMSRYRNLPGYGQAWLMLAAIGSVAASVYIIFGLGNILTQSLGMRFYVPLETEYFYFMLALLLPLAFLIYPLSDASKNHVPWY
ncbi:MAG TPA: hypothetical protein VMX97_13685, partial [Hyphomicrobiaceae bacterium]|nr:hypothetical protein [Hyphomicrobiaceae bacterium]